MEFLSREKYVLLSYLSSFIIAGESSIRLSCDYHMHTHSLQGYCGLYIIACLM